MNNDNSIKSFKILFTLSEITLGHIWKCLVDHSRARHSSGVQQQCPTFYDIFSCKGQEEMRFLLATSWRETDVERELECA